MINVPLNQEPHPSHKFGLWESTIVSLPSADRLGQIRECECGAVDIKAGGSGSRWIDNGADQPCLCAASNYNEDSDDGSFY